VNAAPHRVARIITRLNIGGPAIQAIELGTPLRARGFETCLIHGRLGASEGDMTAFLPLRGAESIYVDDLVRPVAPLRDVKALWHIYRALCRWNPHVVHTHMAKAGTLGRLATLLYNRTQGRHRPAKIVHTYHGHVFEGYFGSFSTKVFLAIERWLGRHTDVLIAISNQIREDLLHTFKVAHEGQVAVVPLGFDLAPLLSITAEDRNASRALLAIPDGAFVVATVGRLTAIKQHALFLTMAAELSTQSDKFVFLVVGDGELRSRLERQAADLGIADRTRFLGWRGDLAHIYGAADIFVLTSLNEGTPVALIEAMAAGVPSVSTNVGGVRDVIASDRLGVLVPFGDANALAAVVRDLAASPDRRRDMAIDGRGFVAERFDRQRLAADVAALYWRLLNIRTTI
jgi:glycosyltransferase involved in cell wall biosynthesis